MFPEFFQCPTTVVWIKNSITEPISNYQIKTYFHDTPATNNINLSNIANLPLAI